MTFDFFPENYWSKSDTVQMNLTGNGTADLLVRTTNLIYLFRHSAEVYMNECGNAWSPLILLPSFPSSELEADGWSNDLLGTGTGCLTWTSSLGTAGRKRLCFINVGKGNALNLLQTVTNNFGASTKLHYASSATFALADETNGHKWRTLMPFAVQLVKRNFTVDRISKTYGLTTYSYHHRFYDANGSSNREFWGFARVEMIDTESFESLNQFSKRESHWGNNEVTHMSLILTKTWGAWLRSCGGVYFNCLTSEDYSGHKLLNDAPLPNEYAFKHRNIATSFTPTAKEYRQVSRSLKGAVLRQEMYTKDGHPEKRSRPHVITEQSYSLKKYQPSADPFESGHS